MQLGAAVPVLTLVHFAEGPLSHQLTQLQVLAIDLPAHCTVQPKKERKTKTAQESEREGAPEGELGLKLCARFGVVGVIISFKVLVVFLPVEPGQPAADERQHEQKQQ